MANPRLVYDYHDVGAPPLLLSFAGDGVTIVYSATQNGGSASKGLGCRIMPGTNKTVELVGDAEAVLGRIDHVEPDGTVVVHVGPVVYLPGGTSATLTPGSKIVGDLGGGGAAEGYIQSVTAATLAQVAVAKGQIIDNADTTDVAVLMVG